MLKQDAALLNVNESRRPRSLSSALLHPVQHIPSIRMRFATTWMKKDSWTHLGLCVLTVSVKTGCISRDGKAIETYKSYCSTSSLSRALLIMFPRHISTQDMVMLYGLNWPLCLHNTKMSPAVFLLIWNWVKIRLSARNDRTFQMMGND